MYYKHNENPRIYGDWGGNPNGWPENTGRCIVSVPESSGWLYRQCSRQRGHGADGLYCKQHAKIYCKEDK